MTATKQVEPRPVGRPSKLNKQVTEEIARAVRMGQTLTVAASLAKIRRSTLYVWFGQAAQAQAKLDQGTHSMADLTKLEKDCLHFSDQMQFARDQAEAIAVGAWVSAGIRPSITKQRKSRVIGTTDEDQPIYGTEETVTEAPPDWRAVQAWLASQRKGYSPKQQLEVTGADGGPMVVEFAVQLEQVRDKIRQHQQAIPAEST